MPKQVLHWHAQQMITNIKYAFSCASTGCYSARLPSAGSHPLAQVIPLEWEVSRSMIKYPRTGEYNKARAWLGLSERKFM